MNRLIQYLMYVSLAAVMVLIVPIRAVHAAEVRIIETWPAGDDVVLARNQNFYLRLAYDSEQPVGIWVTPFHHGKPVNVGSSPSPRYSGKGEALAWFFFFQPGEQVDEIRIKAGDGRTESTPVVATWNGHLSGGVQNQTTTTPPDWVTRMLAEVKTRQDAAYRTQMNQPISTRDVALLNGFMLGMFALGLAGIIAPAWGVRHWQGGWRLAAAVPATMMVFVVVRLLFDAMRDPTSHNLWPFEILMTGALSIAVMAVLWILRKHFGQKGE